MNKVLKIRESLCKGCRYCIKTCPDNALFLGDKFNIRGCHPIKWRGDCSFCGMCYTVCPDFVIEIIEDIKKRNPSNAE